MRGSLSGLFLGLSLALILVAAAAVPSIAADDAVVDDTTCVAEVEPNDDSTEAVSFAGERCISGTLVEVGDTDIFLWQVDEADAAVTWSLSLRGVPESATAVSLTRVDEAGDAEVSVALETSAIEQTAQRDVAVEAGTYALEVTREDQADGVELTADRSYELRVAKVSPSETPSPAVEGESARILVVAGDEVTPAIGGQVAVELLLDTSGSMLERLGKDTKLDAAKRALVRAVDRVPAGTPVALRTFKDKPRSCATVLRVPLEPLRPKAMKRTIVDLPARKGTRTPIAKAISQVPQDLSSVEGHRVVVLVTDGKEDCDGDPAAAITALTEAGYATTVHLIGYAQPDDAELPGLMAEWARLGGGNYYDAPDASSLSAALESVLTAPYLVFDADGGLVARGLVGDEGVEVDAGIYRVEVFTDPPATFEAVELEAGAAVELPVGEGSTATG